MGSGAKKGDFTKVSPETAKGEDNLSSQLAALRRSQTQIRAESKSSKPVDFDWGDEHDSEEAKDEDAANEKADAESKEQTTLTHGEDGKNSDDGEDTGTQMLNLTNPEEELRFTESIKQKSQKIRDQFRSLREITANKMISMKEAFSKQQYDESSPVHTLNQMVKGKLDSLVQTPGPSIIGEINAYLDFVKSQPPLKKALGPVMLKKFQGKILEREKRAIADMRAALGMDGEHPERQSLDTQEENLERTIGAVIPCVMEATTAKILLDAGIEMMIEIDKCRQLNLM